MRQTLHTRPSSYRFGEFTLDVARGCLLRSAEEIKLRPKVYEALKYLVENPGRLIAKAELIQAVWPDTFVTDDSLVQCTLELRRALGDRDQQLLKTVPRRGYLFTPEVTQSTLGREISRGRSDTDQRLGGSVSQVARPLVAMPTPRTPLIGREREVTQAAEFLLDPNVRLLSLTGAGGAGKTRLAIAVASRVSDNFPAGVRFVGLSSITRSELVPTALAKALELPHTPNRAFPQVLSDYLTDSGPFLFVLDNFEQVLPAATIVAAMLAASPNLKVLVTSRACLQVYGEQEFPVAPLEQDSAVQLFVQRATAVRLNFTMTAENSGAIREICSRVDGLPLAIELAAARTKLLSPQAILERLESRLQLLTGGALDLPERQQTLRKTIDWSHGLLNQAEQKLLRRFSVFTGGSTIEGAEAVCNTGLDLGLDVFEGISSLVGKNLVQRVDLPDSEARFTMLETIREYADERLAASGEQARTRRAHAAYCLVLAEEGNPELSSAERVQWLQRCDLEMDNFRSALDWLFASQDLGWGLRLCVALFRFWDMREHLGEGRSRLEEALRLAGEGYVEQRARVGIFLAALSTTQGDFTAGRRFAKQSLSLYEELNHRRGIAASLNALGIAAEDSGDYETAQASFERCLECWRVLAEPLETARCLHNLANVAKIRRHYPSAQVALREATEIFEGVGDRSGAAWSINQQGDIAREQGEIDAARQHYRRALNLFREAGDRWGCGRSLADLGAVDGEQSEYKAAHASYREALEVFAELGHKRGMARVLEGSACLAAAQGQAPRALRLAAAAEHLRRLIGAPMPQAEQEKLRQKLSSAWNTLGEREGQRAWAEGAAMTIDGAIQYSLEEKS